MSGAASPGRPLSGRPLSGRRAKLLLILVGVVLAGLVLTAWTQTWFTIKLTEAQPVVSDGSVAAPALTALALSELVLLGAIAIAGRFFRIVLGIIQALVGITIAYSAFLALASPITASAAAITAASGVAGDESVAALVTSVHATAWPWVALVSGVLLVVASILIIATARSWPGSTQRKYTRAPTPDAGHTSVDDWDALSGGGDPTR